MIFFSGFIRQLLSKKEKKESALSSISNNNRKNSISKILSASNKLLSSEMEYKSAVTSPISSLKQSSKDGYNFRYNEDGRRCHGNEDAAYMMPNDDDGITLMIIDNRLSVN
jgi:hypothetical protein